tara:strand:+ start:405 stop:611 length:207 start_codon:yes stop_codon:yes gene_type:complete
MNNEITSETIKDFRARNRITQDELSKKLGYSRSMIAQIENNMTEITPRTKILLKYVIEEVDNANQRTD